MSRILIVDDHQQDRYMLKALLQGYGYDIFEAGDGVEALRVAREVSPALIISDILMPGMDGFKLCREWKADDKLKHIPFVYYTATYTDSRDEELAQSLGADKFLVKPLEPEAFIDSIHEILAEPKDARPVIAAELAADEETFLKEYNEALIRKLEDKLVQVEQSNRALGQEVADHKQTTGRLRKVNRALNTLSDVNQTLIRAREQESLLHNVCEILIKVGGYRLAWVGMALHDEANAILPAGHAGEHDQFLSHSRLTWGETGPDSEPTGNAIRTGEIVTIADIANSPVHEKWRGRCLHLGFASVIALPLKIGQEVIGALSIFSNSVDFFDSEEVALLAELADDTAYGIHALQVAAEHDKTKAALEAAHEQLAATMDALPDLLFEVDREGRVYDYRATDPQLLYVPPEDFLSKKMSDILPQEAGHVFIAAIKKAAKRGIHTGDQYSLKLPSGIKWFELSIAVKGDRKKSSGRFIALARDITDRKSAEGALRSSEAKYQELYDLAPVAYFSVGSDGRITAVNKAAVKLTGYPKKQLLSMKISELHTQASLGKARELFHRISRGFAISNEEMVYRRKNGQTVHGLLSVSPQLDEEGRVIGFKSVVIDITQRLLAEKALETSEARYRGLVENVPVSIWEGDCSGVLQYVGDLRRAGVSEIRAYFRQHPENVMQCAGKIKLLGVNRFTLELFQAKSERELRGKIGRVIEDSHEAIVEALVAVAERKKQFGSETTLCTLRKKKIQVSLNMIVAPGHEETFDRVLMSMSDITEQKNTAEQLAVFRRLAESSGQAIGMATLDSKVTYINPTFNSLLEKEEPPEDTYGKSFVSSYPKEIQKRMEDEVFPTVIEGGQWAGESTILSSKGKEIPVIENFFIIRDQESKPLYIADIITDISERKELEEQLLHSQKMEAVGRLAGGVAHDFNNLLTLILGYCQILMPGFDEQDPVHKDIQEINEAAERAAALTHQLLAFSRRQVLQLKVLDLNKLVSQMEKMLSRLIREDIILEIELAENLGNIEADNGQIEQIIMNLVVNARDAMPKGGNISIATQSTSFKEKFFHNRAEVQAGDYVMLTISDTGTGIPKDIQDKIFDPFFTTKRKGEGTGLGLSTVYGTVKQSGGYVWVSSEPGEGTSFTVCLPEVDEKVKPVTEVRETDSVRGAETVLVVEDDDTVRTLTCKILQRYGYSVLEAENGGSAMLICEQYKEPIHLVLTDVIMPMMSGLEFVERLHPLHPELKILYMSGYTDEMIDSESIKKPGTSFIQKPFTPLSLVGKVREVIDG